MSDTLKSNSENSSKVDSLNKMPFVGSKDLDGVAFPFYMIVKSSSNSLLPEKWDAVSKSASDHAADYKKGDVIKIVGMEQNTKMKDKWLMLITDDNKAIWSEGLKPEDVIFSATVTPSLDSPFRISGTTAGADVMKKEFGELFEAVPMWAKALPVAGVLAGIIYSWNTKKGFAAHIGYGLVGGLIFTAPANYYITLGAEKLDKQKS